MKKVGFLSLFVSLIGCMLLNPGVREYIDTRGFCLFGATLFSHSEELSIEQLLLEANGLVDHRVIVEGDVLGLGELGTYLILGDDASRLLVLVSGLADLLDIQDSKVKILGVVESGKNGLPLLRAKALKET